MNADKKIGHLLSELGIDGDLKEAIRNIILQSMELRNLVRCKERFIDVLESNILKHSGAIKGKLKVCPYCFMQFKEYPHYCQDHIMVSEQTRYWIDDQAYNASKIIQC